MFSLICTWVGLVTIIIGNIILLLFIYFWCTGEKISQKALDQAYAEGRRDERSALVDYSWWFSEDPNTMLLLQDLRSCSIDTARERWRKRRNKGVSNADM